MKRALLALALCLIPTSAAAQSQENGVELAPPPPVYVAPDPAPNGFTAKLWGGPSYREIFSVPIYGAEMGLALGGQRGHVAVYGYGDLLIGQTQFGLPTKQVHTGAFVERREGAWRIGAGIQATYLAVQRVTSSDVISSYGLGLQILGSVDLWESEAGHALYLGAALRGDILIPFLADNGASDSFVYGPTLSLGVRY